MNEELIADIEGARFTPVRIREGYDMRAVDEFLDRVIVDLRAGRDLSSTLAAADFPRTRMREGYDAQDVDRFLARLTSASSSGTASPRKAPVSGASVEGVIKENRSLWQRLTVQNGRGGSSDGSW